MSILCHPRYVRCHTLGMVQHSPDLKTDGNFIADFPQIIRGKFADLIFNFEWIANFILREIKLFKKKNKYRNDQFLQIEPYFLVH